MINTSGAGGYAANGSTTTPRKRGTPVAACTIAKANGWSAGTLTGVRPASPAAGLCQIPVRPEVSGNRVTEAGAVGTMPMTHQWGIT